MLLRNGGTHRLSVPCFVGLANMALLLLAAATLLWILATKIKQNSTRLLLLVLFFLFPFGINVVYFISKGMEHTLMTFSFGLLYLLAVLFLQELPHNKTQKFLRYAAYAAMGLGIWCNVIYANQSYLKVALEEKATDALMVRVVGRLEQTEGYVPGETPIAVVGLLPTSPLYKTMDGFEDVRGPHCGCLYCQLGKHLLPLYGKCFKLSRQTLLSDQR